MSFKSLVAFVLLTVVAFRRAPLSLFAKSVPDTARTAMGTTAIRNASSATALAHYRDWKNGPEMAIVPPGRFVLQNA